MELKKPGQFRIGKTKKDRANGAQAKNQSNKDQRVTWQKDAKATTRDFPYHTCNGKRNRFF